MGSGQVDIGQTISFKLCLICFGGIPGLKIKAWTTTHCGFWLVEADNQKLNDI
jgi:hypothetical protein